ncbi:MAG: hypothetical protein A2X28_07510 [Elusimicrobia bacterium GWA2_56_46]|nr:MAG: hypothetical protein A2X28_07510 [Elusimicrobia bacterium GWA2_56_46]OGR55652.1 MAG: hypothetical protein A2X39_04635 [Elusimicrobia bacterium GWC2_56_31]HBB66136.1 hypothetical protein [Elusimicrobiota bacterium]HBW23528.1 hypothetical protein [Elusimicrobiota bacterium]
MPDKDGFMPMAESGHGILELEKAELARELAAARKQIETERKKYKALFNCAPVPCLALDPEGRIVEANKPAAVFSGYAPDELLGRGAEEFITEADRRKFSAAFAAALNKSYLENIETAFVIKKGSERNIILNFSSIKGETGGVERIHCAFIDVTERKAAETGLKKNLRLYNFLAQINLAAAKIKDSEQLLSQICEIAVNNGGFKMAWAGIPDKDVGRIIPFYSAGTVRGYLDSLKIDMEGATSKGPTGTAAATGEIRTCPDIANDPAMFPWRARALERGYRSSAAIPLLENGKLAAVLSIYSSETFFFTSEEIKLLSEIQASVSLALAAIASEKKRSETQAALARTAGHLTRVMEAAPVILFTLRYVNGRFIPEWISGNTQGLLGYEPVEMLQPGWRENNIHPLDVSRVEAGKKDLLEKGSLSQDFRVKKKNGGYLWIHSQLKVASKSEGEVAGSWIDITPLKESEEYFQELFDKAPVGYQSLDSDGKILTVNKTWETTFGYSAAEIRGRYLWDFMTPGNREHCREAFRKCMADGTVDGIKTEITRKDGTKRNLSFNGCVAYNRDGSFRQLNCVFADLTGQVRASQ